jgi:hypothetical protein
MPIMRFEFEGDDLSEQLKEELYKSQLVEMDSNSSRYKVVWKTPLNFYVIQYNSKSNKQSSIVTFKESFDTVKKFLKDIKDKYIFDEVIKFLEDISNKYSRADDIEGFLQRVKNKYGEASYIEHKGNVIEKISKKYIEQALKLFFNNEGIRWEWDHTSFLRSYFNFPDAVMGFVDDVIEFYQKNIVSKFNQKHNETSELYREKMKSIKKELEAKLEVVKILKEGEKSIKGKPDILCIAISNLIAYPIKQERSVEQNITTSNSSVDPQEQNKYTGPIMEIDGLILGLTTEKQLFICLIEAKGGNENAVKDMTEKIECRKNDVLRGYDISDLTSLVKGLKDNEKDLSIAYLIITDEKIPTT